MTYRQGAIAIIVYDLVTALLALIPSYSIFTWKMLYMIPGFISVLNKFVKKSRLMHFIWRSIMDGVSFSLFFIVVMAIELEFGFRENRLYFVAVIVSLCMNIYFDTMLYNFWESK